MDCKLEPINNRLDKMDGRLNKMDDRFDKLDSQASALHFGQIETRKEIKEVSIKVSETYALALDSWGQGAENRKWLEKI